MSTPISGSNLSGLLGALNPNSNDPSANAGRTKSSQTGSVADPGSQLAASLAAALQAQAASVNQLMQAFGQALQGATTVDPSTGVREVSASASTQLSTALNGFFVQNGFSQQQADAATKDFVAELAKGGPVDLDASFDESVSVASSMSTSYGSTTMSASSVAVNERSGSVAIDFDPTTGKISISLKEQQMSAITTLTQISGPAALTLPLLALPQPQDGLLNLLPGHGHNSTDNGDSNDATNGQGAAAQSGSASDKTAASNDANSTLNGLLAGLTQPTLHTTQEALDLLGQMLKSMQPGGAAASANGGAAAAGGTQDQSASGAFSVSIGFTQTLSIALHDLTGHGTTLFKRPDGSTGAMSFEPTHVEV
ncbi:hypothetical protein [Paraburkholderia humisilvae]|uniref:Uncharacterized protein n=1 Tax=Paraburkholderia humisilvae TaxID=627669 RepID=A0A6J5D1I9_9BURK|nr:hypothetical protein [Paraburkholderia humisilvae]CAB3747307.1 hypothetical protein LMG29542_00396 [Paraburkholderia humisilvae]